MGIKSTLLKTCGHVDHLQHGKILAASQYIEAARHLVLQHFTGLAKKGVFAGWTFYSSCHRIIRHAVEMAAEEKGESRDLASRSPKHFPG